MLAEFPAPSSVTPADFHEAPAKGAAAGSVLSISTTASTQLTASGYAYDLNGNLTADVGHSYEWDAANRLIAINYTGLGTRTEFAYDGLNRRVRILEKNPGTSFVVQAPNTQYTLFSQTMELPSGNYVLKLEGLNPNGGDNTMFVDAITLGGIAVANGGFETPATGSYVYNPGGGTWTFSGYAGLTANGSGFTSGNPAAPEGAQVGFVQMTGSISQPLTIAGGSYTLSLRAAQRGNYQSNYQQVRVSITSGPLIASTKQFIWNGTGIVEERDGNSAVTRRYYTHGEQRINNATATNFYYTRDHLGSIRELTDAIGAVRARYDYDPFGNTTKLVGDLEVDFGYTGHYRHAASGLYLAPYRAYDPTIGRWISRDPIEEAGGLNLYGYVYNSPLNFVDPLGLDVAGAFAIGSGQLSFTDNQRTTVTRSFFGRLFGNASNQPLSFNSGAGSGTNLVADMAERGTGPLPTGRYAIYERPGAIAGRPAYILDPVDEVRFNDRWDGRQDGINRSAFRLHTAVPGEPRDGSDGCIVVDANRLNALHKFLQGTQMGSPQTIAGFTGRYVGTLNVTP